VAIGRLNGSLIRRTSDRLGATGKDVVGSCRYNLTLINRCYPEGEVVKLKKEPGFGRDRCTVSWHADSTLEHYSSIAVYHCTKGEGASEGDKPWRVALRVCHNAEGPMMGKAHLLEANQASIASAPALAVPLASGSAYYLLDDFNHHHQHSVLAGSTHRFASTHRVCRTEGHTHASIAARCLAALAGTGSSAKQIRAEQTALNEVEFEWIRQMFIQGELHYELHEWWHGPMQELLGLWARLQERVAMHMATLRDAAGGLAEAEEALALLHDAHGGGAEKDEEDGGGEDGGGKAGSGRRKLRRQLEKRRKRCTAVDASSYDGLVQGLAERLEKRRGWLTREQDPAFHSVPDNCRPMRIPFPCPAPLPDSPEGLAGLERAVEDVKGFREAFSGGAPLPAARAVEPLPVPIKQPGGTAATQAEGSVGADGKGFGKGKHGRPEMGKREGGVKRRREADDGKAGMKKKKRKKGKREREAQRRTTQAL
jgi:hypothetical protein